MTPSSSTPPCYPATQPLDLQQVIGTIIENIITTEIPGESSFTRAEVEWFIAHTLQLQGIAFTPERLSWFRQNIVKGTAIDGTFPLLPFKVPDHYPKMLEFVSPGEYTLVSLFQTVMEQADREQWDRTTLCDRLNRIYGILNEVADVAPAFQVMAQVNSPEARGYAQGRAVIEVRNKTTMGSILEWNETECYWEMWHSEPQNRGLNLSNWDEYVRWFGSPVDSYPELYPPQPGDDDYDYGGDEEED